MSNNVQGPTSAVPTAKKRSPRGLLASGAAVLLALASVLLGWPASAAAGSYDEPSLDLVKSAVQDGQTLADGAVLIPGDSFDYVIEVTNTGKTQARSVVVTDDLPASVVPTGAVTVRDGATVLDTQPGHDPVSVDLGALTAGQERTITIPVKVAGDAKGCTTFSNVATASFKHGYGDVYTDTSNTVNLAVGCADLVIKKVADVDGPVAVGDKVTFDISASLADVDQPVAVKPVVITDAIDTTRFEFVSASNGGTYADGVVTWTLAAGLAPGDPPTKVSLTLKVLPAPQGSDSSTYSNTACIELTPGDETPVISTDDDCDTATVSTGSIDLSLGKLVNGQPTATVAVGDTVTYSLTVDNAGPDNATGVVVEDAIPSAVTFIEQTGGQGTLSADGSTWKVGSVDAGGSAQVTFTATVDQPGSHTNVAEITKADQPDTDSTPGNGCTGASAAEDDCAEATVIATLPSGSLGLVKSNDPTGTLDNWVDGNGTARTVAYTLTVSAGSGAAQEDVVVTDTIPAGTELVEGTATCDGGPADCASVNGSDISWNVGTLAAGTSATVRFTVALIAPTSEQQAAGGYTIRNAGVATSTTDRTPSNEVKNPVTLPKATPAPLTIVKSNDPTDVVKFGDTITYTLTVSMPASGTVAQTGVVVTDTLPGYDEAQPTSGTVTYVPGSASCIGAPPPGGTCIVTETLAGDTTTGLAWALGTMKPGDSRAVTFEVTADKQPAVVDGSETVDFINVAAVSSDDQPTAPSNLVVNTAVLTEVSDVELPHTGSGYPLGRIALLGVALLALGTTLVRRSTPRPVRVTGKHAAS